MAEIDDLISKYTRDLMKMKSKWESMGFETQAEAVNAAEEKPAENENRSMTPPGERQGVEENDGMAADEEAALRPETSPAPAGEEESAAEEEIEPPTEENTVAEENEGAEAEISGGEAEENTEESPMPEQEIPDTADAENQSGEAKTGNSENTDTRKSKEEQETAETENNGDEAENNTEQSPPTDKAVVPGEENSGGEEENREPPRQEIKLPPATAESLEILPLEEESSRQPDVPGEGKDSFALFTARVFAGDSVYPIPGAKILIYLGKELHAFLITNEEGETPWIRLASYPKENSLEPLNTQQSLDYYADVYAPGFTERKGLLVSAVGGSKIILRVPLTPQEERID